MLGWSMRKEEERFKTRLRQAINDFEKAWGKVYVQPDVIYLSWETCMIWRWEGGEEIPCEAWAPCGPGFSVR